MIRTRLNLICTTFLFLFFTFIPVNALTTSAQSVVLMEQESGRILYQQNPHDPNLIASITKLLTALVAVEENLPLEDFVEITAESTLVEGSSLYLEEGQRFTLETLLYGMLLHSGNDAATAIALHCSDTVAEFVAKMNEKSQELGMRNSSFANPHGLNDENHYSTAYDMALVAQACLENEVVAKIVSTQSISLEGRTFTNKNKLLSLYDGCIGMKTGYTELAGRTLVSAATRDDMTLICVTLDAPDDWLDHTTLFDYGFATYEISSFVSELAPSAQIPLKNSVIPFVSVGLEENFCYPVTKNESLTWQLYLSPQEAVAPVKKGDEVEGCVIWYLDGKEVGQSSLVYQDTIPDLVVEPVTLWTKFTKIVEDIWLGED